MKRSWRPMSRAKKSIPCRALIPAFLHISWKPVSDELPDGGQSTASHCHIDIRIFEQNFDLAMIKNEG